MYSSGIFFKLLSLAWEKLGERRGTSLCNGAVVESFVQAERVRIEIAATAGHAKTRDRGVWCDGFITFLH
jgi:hypothetical protein